MNLRLLSGLRWIVIVVGCFVSLSAAADMSDDERKLWVKEKTVRVNEFSKKFEDEIKRVFPSYEGNAHSADASVLYATVARMKAEEPAEKVIRSDVARFLQSSNAEALENFKDNPLCVRAATAYQTVANDVSSGKTSPVGAILNYPLSVLLSCGISSKAGQHLEKQHTKQ